MVRHRHRRGFYPLAQTSTLPSVMKRVVLLIVLGILFFWIGTKILSSFGVGNTIKQNPVRLSVEEQGSVSVSIEGENPKRAEDQLKLYPRDRVQTGGRSNAVLSFFDGTIVRMDEQTEVHIHKSAHGEKSSEFSLELLNGSIWVASPSKESFTGSILREITTSNIKMNIPSGTEAMVSPISLAVFSSDDLGLMVWLTGNKENIIIGEGQKIVVPDKEAITGNGYKYRSPLDPTVVQSPFLEQSKREYSILSQKSDEKEIVTEPEIEEPLAVSQPQDGITVSTSTIKISGSIGPNVASVRINGYNLVLEEGERTFTQDLSLPDEDQVSILIEALDSDGVVLAEKRRSVRRDREPPAPPVITSPAKGGETYLTSKEDIEITGKVTKDIIGIEVNDYRLQLFEQGNDSWSYLASNKLGNFKFGENVLTITAINKGGYKSEPTVLTIILGEGEEGILEETPASAEATAGREETEESEDSEESLTPDDDAEESASIDYTPLAPGTLQVTGPTPGTSHTATGSSFLLEGTTVPQTHSVYVNDYKLRLYESGKDFWNYIADTKMGTLHRGTNIFRITSRDIDGKLLDEIEYMVRYDPRSN